MLEPGKLLQLKVDHPLFWRYLIAFVSLLDPLHAAELRCPGCESMKMVRNPHNFYTHVLFQHDALSLEARGAGHVVGAPPNFPPALDRDLETLSERALIHIPQQWLAAMPIASLPPGVQGRIRAYTDSIMAASQQPTTTAVAAATPTTITLLPQLHADMDGDNAPCPTPLSSLLYAE